jgi:hypothetical protein
VRVLRPLVRLAPTRLLIATLVGALVAVAALAGSMASSAAPGQAKLAASLANTAPTRVTAGDGVCATIDRNNVEKQMNARAGEILAACGRAPSRPANDRLFTALGQLSSSPNDYGGTDVNVITGGEGASPKVTQSEVQVWSQGNTVVAALDEPEHEAVLYGPRHRLRRPGRLLRHRALEVGRDLPRLRLRRPGDRRLVLDRRHHLDGRSLRP